MTVESAKTRLDDGEYVDLHADGRSLVLTNEHNGRTTGRVRLSFDAARALTCFLKGLRGAKDVEDAVKRLR